VIHCFQSKDKGAPFAFLTFHADRSTVGFDDLFNDGQSQTGSRLFFLAGDTEELFEDPGKILTGNPLSRIGDGKTDLLFFRPGRKGNRAAGRGVSKGIGKKIAKDIIDPGRIGSDIV
jgi:hypothetical protein